MPLTTALAGQVVVIPIPGATVPIVILLVREAVEEGAEAASRAAIAATLAGIAVEEVEKVVHCARSFRTVARVHKNPGHIQCGQARV